MCIAQKIVDKRSARKAENRIAIMDAAEKLVLAGGLKALTADTLAAESGVSRRTIFNHFSSVEAAAVERLNDNKFNEYSSTSYLNSIEMVVDKLWQQRQDIPRMRIAIFGNLIASAVCEGIAASFYDAEGNPKPPEDAEKMRDSIEHCLGYVEELLGGQYA